RLGLSPRRPEAHGQLMAMDVLYFAWVREGVGIGQERVDPPDAVRNVADLICWLAERSPGHAAVLGDPARLRAAVDQIFVPLAATIVHRVGAMVPGDRIVFVATAASHRAAALEACAYLIDRLKTDAPFWKRETRGDTPAWVEARCSDTEAKERWIK